MFCPNCGTQNPDNATSCFKCGFNLTGAAAPKFKGTMLMGQQPPAAHGGGGHAPMPDAGLGATVAIDQVPELALGGAMGGPMGGAPPAAGNPGGYPPPGGGAPQGYPPPGGGFGAPQGGPPQHGGFGPPPGGAPQQGGFGPPPGGAPQQGGFGPPPGGAPQQGGFGPPPGGAPQQGGFGPPPGGAPQQGFGQPQGGMGGPQQGGFGAPPGGGAPGGYGAPPQAAAAGFGQPPGGMGGPQQGGYGAPPGGAPGGAPGGFGGMAAGMGGMVGGAMGGLQAASAGGAIKTRNPIMVLGLTLGLIVLGNILSSVLGAITPVLGYVGSLVNLAGVVMFYVFVIQMLMELKNFTKNDAFNWWFCLIPCFNLYFFGFMVPPEIQKAKQMAGSMNQQTKHMALYIFAAPWALASDLNDVANPRG